MTINISFAEIAAYVKTHYGKDVELSRAGEQELRVAYVQRAVIASIRVPVTLRIDCAHCDAMELSYSGPLGIDKLIRATVAFLVYKKPELRGVLSVASGNRITVELSQLDRMRPVLEKVALRDIAVVDDGLGIEVELK
ncbi:MAG: hypothetical protein K2G07_05710 [Muribaculaceae bacterium]|nr:hypothetical protein [Muribaculaceae bacterium]